MTLAAQAQEITLKVHHFLGPQSVQNTAMLGAWCDKLAKESANRLKCQLYPAMQLGGTPSQLYDQAKDGVADVVWTIAGYSANRFPRIEVFELPFMMTNPEATSRAAWDYYSTHARDEFSDTRILAIHMHGPGNLFTARKKIEKLPDFKGMKLRAPTRLTNKMLALMGATPVGMPVPAVPDALAKGLIDGAVLPYEVTPGIKVNELVKYTAEPDRNFNALYTAVFIVAMNKDKYESLPADLKKVIDANSGREFSAFLGKTQSAADADAKEKVLASGVQVNVIPKAELDNWKKATDQLNDDWVKNLTARGYDGKFLLHSARELITRHTK
jgi:TRAP-type C4-dicarboxylate transport system substrate-binding protein